MSETDTTERPTGTDLDEIYFQPLEFEGIYGRVYNLFVRKWFLFLTITAVSHLIMIGSVLLVVFFIVGDVAYAYANEGMVGSEVFLAIAIGLIVFLAVQCIADGASIRAVAEIYAGKNPSIWGCTRASARKVVSLIGSSLMVASLFLLPVLPLVWWIVEGMIEEHLFLFIYSCLVIFPVYVVGLSIYTYVMYAAVIVENESPVGGFTRSISLVKNNFCDVFCVLFVFCVGKFIIGLLLSSLTGGLGDHDGFDTPDTVDFNMGGGGIFKLIFAIVFASLGSILQAVIYFNLGVKKDGWTSTEVAERLCLDGYLLIHGDEGNALV